ncbi:drug/metabolite transporter (DMT)-like permease [Agromyces flavus]|uniref:Drug/metabolite transporter (DMT)-like permease n=1 Tax=Agromyces flavus TaxID=589382 RepID=A0A1H1ZL79_9MICO|nr:DMT family transporter [Agromyces flavus]MCP2367143.1 drug/metabolite transporter (DMT)-like permease [Agromyces flavus]GGI46312.1 transporter [Agromyces flavus]SDT34337.1 Permease of the drug/metabolite transporter (DMT) superfamily [Agromyces flavus]
MDTRTSTPNTAAAPSVSTSASPRRRVGGLRTWAQFLAAGLVWGASFLFIAVALTGLSFTQVAWARVVLGAVTLGLVVLVSRPRVDGGPVLPREPVVWLHFLVIGVTGCVVPFLLFAWAQQSVTSSMASILNATTPIMTAIIATLAFRVERLDASRWLGVLVGIIGVAIIIAPWNTELGGDLAGQLAILGATACYGVMFGYTRRFLSGRPIAATTFAFLQVGTAGAVMLLLTPWLAAGPVRLDAAIVVCLAVLGIAGTGLAYVWNIGVIRDWGPTNASTVTYVTPVVGVVLGVLILREPLTWNEPVGALVVMAGILLAQGRVRMPRRATARA